MPRLACRLLKGLALSLAPATGLYQAGPRRGSDHR